MTCYYCDTIVNARNRSAEHILPNAIGGKLKSYRLLCRSCNEILGKTVDATLAARFHDLCIHLGIQRDRPIKPKDETFIDQVSHDENDFFRAIAKIAVNSYLHWGGSRDNIMKSLSFLKGEIPNDNIVHCYHPTEQIEREDNQVTHLIHLVGNRESGNLYANIVLFTSYRFVVNLSENFRGESFSRTYRCDIL